MKIVMFSPRSFKVRILDLATPLEIYNFLITSLDEIVTSSPRSYRARLLDFGTTLETYQFLYTVLYENSNFHSKELQDHISGFGDPS